MIFSASESHKHAQNAQPCIEVRLCFAGALLYFENMADSFGRRDFSRPTLLSLDQHSLYYFTFESAVAPQRGEVVPSVLDFENCHSFVRAYQALQGQEENPGRLEQRVSKVALDLTVSMETRCCYLRTLLVLTR